MRNAGFKQGTLLAKSPSKKADDGMGASQVMSTCSRGSAMQLKKVLSFAEVAASPSTHIMPKSIARDES